MKTTMKRLISFLVALCMTVGLLPISVSAADLEDAFHIPENVVTYELDGSSGNGKNSCEYLWISDNTLYVAFCVRGDKPFKNGQISYAGGSKELVFDESMYAQLEIGTSHTLKPKTGSDGKYYWQIGSCTIPSGIGGNDVTLSVGSGGFGISGYTIGVKYGLDITKTLVSVNGKTPSTSVKEGDKLQWKITVENVGEFKFANVVVEDVLSYSGGGTVGTLGESSFALDAGADKVLLVEYTVRPEDAGETLVNTATATVTGVGLQVDDVHTVSVRMPPATVTWENEDGSVLEIDTNVPYGTLPEYNGALPTKPSDEEYRYVFAGWSPEVDTVTGDVTYTATYTEETRTYTVTWLDEDGTVLEIDEDVPYGATPEYNSPLPTKDSTALHTYTFDGWSPEVDTVTGDAVYTATYAAEQRNHTVTVLLLLDEESADIDEVRPDADALYLSADGGNTFYECEPTDTGIYVATEVPNGTYGIYVLGDDGYERFCEQIIVVKDGDTERECHNYSVAYDANGADCDVPDTSVHHLNASVTVAPDAPQCSGSLFVGWWDDADGDGKVDSGEVYQPGAKLTSAIYRKYTLKALWEETVTVTVNVTIDHVGTSGGCDLLDAKRDVYLELVSRAGENSAYLETGDVLDLSAGSHDGFTLTADEETLTKYTADSATFTGLSGAAEYTVVASKSGYDTEVTATRDEDGNWVINVVMTYTPSNFDLTFTVDVADSVPSRYTPVAVIVRISFWAENGGWKVITQQTNGKPGIRVNLDGGTGSGSYPVWKFESESDTPYGYRLLVSAFVYPDGTIVPVDDTSPAKSSWSDGVYIATLDEVTDGQLFGTRKGAWFDATEESQVGDLHVEITMDLHTVTFLANGGEIDGEESLSENEQYCVPDLDGYVPTREDGYVFEGWYLDENGNGALDAGETDTPVAGSDLTEDITLIARWKAPLTVSGSIAVAGSYTLDDEIKIIQDADRAKEVIVILQYAAEGSTVFSDVREYTASIVYSGNSGTGTYKFTEVPDWDGTWRVRVLGLNYTTKYKNEGASSFGNETGTLASPSIAKDTSPKNGTAVVNIQMEFEPNDFTLYYEVDASAIGEDFRPEKAEVLVLYNDETDPNRAPQAWPVISQMQAGGTAPNFTYKGDSVTVGTEASHDVWSHHPNGHLYDYAIRLQAVDGKKLTGNEPFTVSYNGSAEYQTSGGYANQTHLLTATLIPKTYHITYDLGVNGYWPGGAAPETHHTWSYATEITGEPERAGFRFMGWTANVSGAYANGKITAATAQDVTLTAVWAAETYTVIWWNDTNENDEIDDGEVLETDTNVSYGATPAYNGATPTKASTEDTTFHFSGWTPSLAPVDGNISYKATYREEERLYTITWKGHHGEVLRRDSLPYGAMPDYGADPQHTPDSQYVYTFEGWSPEVDTVTGDAVYTATYSYVDRLHTGCARIYLDELLTDVETVLGEGAELYFSADESEYYEITGGDGVYDNYAMPHGDYLLYYSIDGGSTYTQIGNQILTIDGSDTEIDVYYYSVTYDLNGGTDGPEEPEYYLAGSAVSVDASSAPQCSGSLFVGWWDDADGDGKVDSGEVYQPGAKLTSAIYRKYTLKALWEETVTVTVNVTIDHVGTSGGCDLLDTKRDVYLELVSRAGENSAYLETGDVLDLSEGSHDGFTLTADEETLTKYTADGATFTGLSGAAEYTVVASKSGYDTEVTATRDEDGNWVINVVMTYMPSNFDLTFTVDVADSVPSRYTPVAVIVRISFWAENGGWKVITQQTGGKPGIRVNLDGGTGSGSYPVWKFESESDTPYGYRLLVSAFVYPDGTIVPVDDTSPAKSSWSDGVYIATLDEVTDGQLFGTQKGAWFDATEESQVGDLHVEITMDLHTVTFLANGGEIDGEESLSENEQYCVPDLDGYVPTREDGYVFEGWYLDENGNGALEAGETDTPVAGSDLTEDITLIAKWKAPLTVSGSIAVAGSYGNNKIHDEDRPETVVVTLYRKAQNAQHAEVYGTPIVVEIENEVDGTRKDPGTGTYTFTNLPNDDSTYYITVQARNFEAKFWNEALTASAATYSAYTKTNNTAVDKEPNGTATVHAYLVFDPQNFDLDYRIDATAIGTGFRPTNVKVLVQYDNLPDAGYTWATISQQIEDGQESGQNCTLSASGIGQGVHAVWQYHPMGHAYNYRVLLQSVTYKPTGTTASTATNLDAAPFTVTYTYPAFYDSSTEDQNILLTVRLTPKTYQITYDLGAGGTWPEGITPVSQHTWSKATTINAAPVRSGYVFDGWEVSVNGAYANGEITAATAQDVTLTAIWVELRDITVRGQSGSGVYNGQLQNLTGFTVEGLPANHTITGLTYTAEGIDAGTYTGSFSGSAKVLDGQGNNVTDYFRFTLLPGTLVIEENANGDDIPDSQQKKVTFRVVNGSWNDGTSADKVVYVTLLKDGQPDEDGTGALTSPKVGGKPDTGYRSGSWDVTPPATVSGSDEVTYTYTYQEIVVPTPPEVPDLPVIPEDPEDPDDSDDPKPPVGSQTGSVVLTKVDSEDWDTTLANVIFSLFHADGTAVGTYTTGADGTITVSNLPVGSYYWIEVRPAEGYTLDASRRTFRVTGGGTARLTVSNTRTSVPEAFSGEHYAYIIGGDDGLVRPEATITRAEVATIFFRLLDDATRDYYLTDENNFLDVEEGMWFNTAISTMAAMGILNGSPDGNFYPNAYITRAEFAAIAARFDAGGNTTGASFSDIYDHWAQKEINLAYNNGWILGYEDGTFKPDQNIVRAEAMTMINRVLQRVPENKDDLLDYMITWPDNQDTTKWYYLAVQEATNSHDYDRKKNGYEYWTELLEVRDWTELEQ